MQLIYPDCHLAAGLLHWHHGSLTEMKRTANRLEKKNPHDHLINIETDHANFPHKTPSPNRVKALSKAVTGGGDKV